MDEGRTNKTPIAVGLYLTKVTEQATKAATKEYQSQVGSLIYGMIETRLDLAYTVSSISQFA